MKSFWLCLRDILAILALTLLCMMLAGLWMDGWEINRIVLPLHYLCAPVIEVVLFWWGFRFLKKKLFHDPFGAVSFPPVFRSRYFGYAVGLLILCGVGTALLGGQLVLPSLDSYLFAQNAASLPGAFLIAPFVEETVFRAVILGQVAKRYGAAAGVAVSSLLFGAVHLMNGALSPASAVQLVAGGALMGALLGVVYVKEGSVWASYTVHALYNGIGSLIPVATAPTPDWPVEFILKNQNAFLTGGEYGIDCSLVNMAAYLVMIGVVLALIHRSDGSLQAAWTGRFSPSALR